MIYNTSLNKLVLPEYGRHVHLMVQHAAQIKDRNERNIAAHTIIGIMGNLQPHLRDIPDFKHKLWDHLFVMSAFKLDIDAPYPLPSPETLMEKPKIVPYPQAHIRQKHYGKILVDMIREAAKMDENARRPLIQILANQMKRTYTAWNKSEVTSEQIARDIWDISDGKITLDPGLVQFVESPRDTRDSRETAPARARRKKLVSSSNMGRKRNG